MSTPLKRNYVSELDQFLQSFDQDHSKKSASQQREIEKHQRIAQCRDNPTQKNSTSSTKEIWEKF